MDTNHIRKRKRPSPFGNNISVSESSAEEGDFADNSFDDPNFEISESKRTRMDDTSSEESITLEQEENFDKEFDQTLSVKLDEFVADVTESNHSKELISVPSEKKRFRITIISKFAKTINDFARKYSGNFNQACCN